VKTRLRLARPALLLVSDDEMVKEIYGEVFRRRGHDVLEAERAEEGLDILAERRDVCTVLIALSQDGWTAEARFRAFRRPMEIHVIEPGPEPESEPAPAKTH
jgi:DNA-binding response OmpR family regulator